jgi:hypothetical protein
MDNQLTNNKWYLGLFQFYLIFALSGCNFIESIFSYSNENNFNDADISFSQEFCGDSLPEDPEVYPVALYSVYVKRTSASNDIDLFKSRFCKNGVPAGNHVDYFTDLERANRMKEIMEKEFGDAVVRNPVVIKAKPPSLSDVAKASQLPDDEVRKLMNLLAQNSLNTTINVIVPTYIPDGFSLDTFKVNHSNLDKFKPRDSNSLFTYQAIYRNSVGSCFIISGTSMRGGAGVGKVETIDVYSPALGEVTIMYAKSDRENQPPFLTLSNFQDPGIIPTSLLYSFGSTTQQENPGCKDTLNINEAAKVVESLHYLNHPLRHNE